jgi:hypothetical protein
MIFTQFLEDTTMGQKPRLKHLLVAGILTGLGLATVVAFTWHDASQADTAATRTTASLTTSAPAGTDALQAENKQLRHAFATMQAREEEYRTQLEAANRAIVQLQVVAANRRDDDHDKREEHKHKHGENEDD